MRILFFFLFTFSLTAGANETVRWQQLPNGIISAWSLHTESGVYNLDRFDKRPGAFQDLREHRAFTDGAKAKAEFERLTGRFHEGKPPLALMRDIAIRSAGEIWPTTQVWNWEWEQKFAKWISEEVNPYFFSTYGISTDCADAAYALRWIFSRINGLPAGNRLSISAQLFNNETLLPEWENLPKAEKWQDDQRFRAALDYLLRNTYTHTLMEDLYPVKISRDSMLPGTIFLHLYSEESGHTELLYQIKEPNHPAPLRVLASNVPREVRDLAEYGMQDWGYQPGAGRDGLLRFRWPVKSAEGWSIVSAEAMPNYSLEQYDPKFMQGFENFVAAVTRKIIPDWKPDSAAVMREKVKLLTERLTGRVKIVSDGFNACQALQGCKEGSGPWETWSTPSRDGAIARLILEIDGLSGTSQCNPGCEASLAQAKSIVLTQVNSAPYSIRNAFEAWENRRYKSDPNAPVAERWGL